MNPVIYHPQTSGFMQQDFNNLTYFRMELSDTFFSLKGNFSLIKSKAATFPR
jgi:hypothetical protein